MCPGLHLAESSLSLMMASILHVFMVEPKLNEIGGSLDGDSNVTDGMIM